MIALRRSDPTDGTVDTISSGAKLYVRHVRFDHIIQSSYTLGALYKAADESMDVDSSVCDKDDNKC